MLFDRVISAGLDDAVGFAALENTAAGDRVIGVCAYAPAGQDGADFCIAVADGVPRGADRHALCCRRCCATRKRVGIPRLSAKMLWSNRPMQLLAHVDGIRGRAVAHDRNLRRLRAGAQVTC